MKTTASLAAVLLAAVLGTAPAVAQEPSLPRADGALAQLSASYTALWSTLSPAEKRAFSAQERHWLHVLRWQEQARCMGQSGAAATPDVADQCLAEVTQRRVETLRAKAVTSSARG